MKRLKQEIYFPIIVAIHLLFWVIDLYLLDIFVFEVDSDTLFFGRLQNETWLNPHRILGEVFSSWVVTVFAFNFLMATRAKWVEKLFGGLDKMYLIHRRAGVIAVFLLIAHFITVPRDAAFNPGKPLGFYSFILIILGVIVSAAPIFKRKIPYHKWLNIHKLMGIFYVLGVIHGFMVNSLIKFLPITRVYVFGMAFIGIAAWFYKAFLFNLFNKKLKYTISTIKDLGYGMTEVTMKSNTGNLKYLAGQFAFFNFPNISKREQHPFTISSHPYHDNLRITVKGLGDYTNNINEKLTIGGEALVEGPYGHFSSKYVKENDQIWIAGGIGITPFLSLSKDLHPNKVKLFWCVKDDNEAVYKKELEATANDNPNFEFVIWNSKTAGYLTADKMKLENYNNKAYLICGPKSLKDNLTQQLKQKNVKSKYIYDEEFAFR